VIVTGDFNEGEGSPPYQALFGAMSGKPSPLRDTYRIAQPVRGTNEGTFTEFKAEATGGERIDWISVSMGWQVKQALIDHTARDGRTPSDHFPMTAVVRLR
jgi:endonuclease/exonuclease/phosphatase family metal-dependent hydrolase